MNSVSERGILRLFPYFVRGVACLAALVLGDWHYALVGLIVADIMRLATPASWDEEPASPSAQRHLCELCAYGWDGPETRCPRCGLQEVEPR